MNKKIKIIDLLNKIANEEEVPKKVKYLNRIYKFYKGEKDYISYDDEKTKWCGQTLLFNIMECHHITELLEAKVEILEDNTEEIEELKKEQEAIANPKTMMQEIRFYYDSNKMGDKINEIIRYIKRKDKSNDN